MTTGISAPPMAAVVVYPFKKLNTVLPARQQAAMIGEPGAKARKVPIVAILAPRRELFTKCRGPGILIGLEDMRPASLRNATTEPVKVTPPGSISCGKCARVGIATDQDSQISSNEMQGRDIIKMSHHTADTGQDSSQTNNRVQCSDSLRQICRCGPSANHQP